tara:strand:- start:301 stop:519 length:219 start_codon:yes stop_codon:yes gene_type:complete
MSNAKDIVGDLKPSVATNSEFWDVEVHLEESKNRCVLLPQNHELQTMLSILNPSMVHRELSIRVFELIVPSA